MYYEHIIFDFDGVIADSFTIAKEELNKLITQQYPAIPHIDSRDDLTIVFSTILSQSLSRFGLTESQSKDFFNRHSAAMHDRAHEISPFKDALEAINSYLRGRCSIVTSAYSDAVQTILKKSGAYLDITFTHILGRELKRTKTEKIHDLLQTLGITAQQALYIGDLASDILYCKKVPIDILTVGYGYHPGWYLQSFSPDYHVKTPSELRHFLFQLNTHWTLTKDKRISLTKGY